ncbi:MAG: hypothetical protein JWM39_731 [Parcubacteria group bacterium]|nr:hypothetical protein [Parcubacteria group bacterium]
MLVLILSIFIIDSAPAMAIAKTFGLNGPTAECKNNVLAKAGISEEKARHLPVGWSYQIGSQTYALTKEMPFIWSGCRESILSAQPARMESAPRVRAEPKPAPTTMRAAPAKPAANAVVQTKQTVIAAKAPVAAKPLAPAKPVAVPVLAKPVAPVVKTPAPVLAPPAPKPAIVPPAPPATKVAEEPAARSPTGSHGIAFLNPDTGTFGDLPSTPATSAPATSMRQASDTARMTTPPGVHLRTAPVNHDADVSQKPSFWASRTWHVILAAIGGIIGLIVAAFLVWRFWPVSSSSHEEEPPTPVAIQHKVEPDPNLVDPEVVPNVDHVDQPERSPEQIEAILAASREIRGETPH